MNRVFYISIFLFVILFTSCKRYSIPQSLKDAEQMMMINRDSAYKTLTIMSKKIEGESEYSKQYYQLLLFRSADLCYIPHSSDSIVKEAIKYGKRINSNTILMQAYYCEGCFYRDKEDAEQALVYYQKALDISKGNTNYNLIGRIYNQIGYLQIFGQSYNDALSFYKKALYNFKLANDSLTIPSAIINIARVYDAQQNDSLALPYYKQAYSLANKLSDKYCSTLIAIELSGIYYTLQQYDSASSLINKTIPSKLKGKQDLAVYYLNKGKISYTDNKIDSAIFYLQESSKYADNRTKRITYNALSQIFKEDKQNYRQALSYLKECLSATDAYRKETHDEEVTRLQSLYNYTRSEKRNKELTKRNNANETIIFISIISLLSLSIVMLLYRHKSTKKRELQKRVIDKLRLQHEASQEYMTEKDKEITELRKQKECNEEKITSLVTLLEVKSDKLRLEAKQNDKRWTIFRESDVYRTFHKILEENKATGEELKRQETVIKEEIDKLFDDFGIRLQECFPYISKQQIRICYLIKAEFSPTEMSTILSVGKQAVSNIRYRMTKNFFSGIDTTKTIDEFIHDF